MIVSAISTFHYGQCSTGPVRHLRDGVCIVHPAAQEESDMQVH